MRRNSVARPTSGHIGISRLVHLRFEETARILSSRRWSDSFRCMRVVATLCRIANFEDKLHVCEIPRATPDGSAGRRDVSRSEAIQGHLQTLRESGEPVPRPTTLAREIEIPPAA